MAKFARRDPPAKLQLIADHLGASCRVSVARYRGRPVAAILVLQGRNAHYTRGAMDEELAAHTQATKLLHARAIEALREAIMPPPQASFSRRPPDEADPRVTLSRHVVSRRPERRHPSPPDTSARKKKWPASRSTNS